MDEMLSRLCDCLNSGNSRLYDGDTTQSPAEHTANTSSSTKYKGFAQEESVNTLLPLGDDRIVFGSGDGVLKAFSYKDESQNFIWDGHDKPITKICHRTAVNDESQSTHMFSASRDLTVKMWSVKDAAAECQQQFTGLHELVISGVASNPDDENIICTGSRDNNIALWDVTSGSVISSNLIARNLVTHLCWKGQLLAQTSEDKSLRLWDHRTLEPTHTFIKKQQILTSCDVNMQQQIITSSGGFNGSGCEITLWDARGINMPVHEFKGHREKVYACCYVDSSYEASLLVSVSADRTIIVWDSSTLTERSRFSMSHQIISITQLPGGDKPEIIRLGVGCFEISGVLIVTLDLRTNQWEIYN